ncbi:MAG: maltotransferase domain-containing protein, partial [Candidatus Limnocylindrales bacterium]
MSDQLGASTFPHRQRRVVIEAVTPQVDGGRFSVKRIVGDRVTIEADVFADGHDDIAARLLWRLGSDEWHAQEMEAVGNDRWRAALALPQIGRYEYVIEGRVDHLLTWIRDLGRRSEAGTVTTVDLQIGSALVSDLASRAADASDATRLRAVADQLVDAATPGSDHATIGRDPSVATLARRYPDLRNAAMSPPLTIVVDRERARFSSWYEAFPRSMSLDEDRHGTFRDVIAALPTVAAMGFDVLYLPPIHPIGRSFRKGPNNALEAGAGDPGVPWAIGSTDGGHDAIHPELGTIDDFRDLVSAARVNGLEIALDIAFQASPDHPWVEQHPTWFKHRPDGSIQYAENPPKRYQDIYPFDFESADWQGLWQALLDVMRHWAAEGVRVFRADNPHTKAFPFWEWAIAALTAEYPDVILLAEAFTRPKVMYRLAKVGFSQSYTYFTWKTTKSELTEYFTELMTTDVRETF